jgi:hypothetical protein
LFCLLPFYVVFLSCCLTVSFVTNVCSTRLSCGVHAPSPIQPNNGMVSVGCECFTYTRSVTRGAALLEALVGCMHASAPANTPSLKCVSLLCLVCFGSPFFHRVIGFVSVNAVVFSFLQ